MIFVYLVAFAVVSIFLVATWHIVVLDKYIGKTMFLAAEYIECAIERKK